jgi:predicted Ser/Thr protein kinase
LKALKRRLDRHEFAYLTNLSLESELLHRELTDKTEVWDANTWDQLEEWIREPLRISVRSDDDVIERELAPHTIEAAALYAVASRLDVGDLPEDLDLVDKALLFDRGYLRIDEERRDTEEFSFDDDATDGSHGIPVTYTRDVIADLLHEESERFHDELPVQDIIMPRDILDAMANRLSAAPVFSEREISEFEQRVVPVKDHIFTQQETDVLDAIMRDKRVDERTVEEYVEHVYAWSEGETIQNERGERIEPDALQMKIFEIEHLGRFADEDYVGNEPRDAVRGFREEQIITALNRHAWRNRDEEFRVSEINPKEIPIIKSVLGSHDWDDVRRTFEDFDPQQWDNPPDGTETAAIKEQTIRNMQELFEYSEASAELTSRHVMSQVSYKWD